MDDVEMDRRVRMARLCLHRRKHYLDGNGNRRCFQCDAFVRSIHGVPVTNQPSLAY